MVLVHEIRIPLEKSPNETRSIAVKRAGLSPSDIRSAHMHKISVDARHQKPCFVCSVALTLQDAAQEDRLKSIHPSVQVKTVRPVVLQPGKETLSGPVVVCGLGPAGLFAALELARAGYAPLVLERGPAMEKRVQKVTEFEKSGDLDLDANIQFGEGGAGTFSDGKLTTRIGDPLCAVVTDTLLACGAPPEIAYQAKPHIGTDLMRRVFVNMRKLLQKLGGQVSFEEALLDVEKGANSVYHIKTSRQEISCGALVLATGHSAHDTYEMLRFRNITLQAKPFSVGARIEHRQSDIDRGLYHEAAGHPALPPGSYQLSTRVGGRGAYTFCMCPGGSVVVAASEREALVTNGMSLHARGGKNANSALVVGVDPAEFDNDPFQAIEFQRRLEQSAFEAGGGGYVAPAESVGSFLKAEGCILPGVEPTYPRGVRPYNLGYLLPPDVTAAMRAAIQTFGRKLPGFDAPGALLTGLETRTSSPVRVLRSESLESMSHPGLYPCGEGAGYAGGIMSAAVDGIRVAHAIINRYSNNQ